MLLAGLLMLASLVLQAGWGLTAVVNLQACAGMQLGQAGLQGHHSQHHHLKTQGQAKTSQVLVRHKFKGKATAAFCDA